jgi:hypothetical protein
MGIAGGELGRFDDRRQIAIDLLNRFDSLTDCECESLMVLLVDIKAELLICRLGV